MNIEHSIIRLLKALDLEHIWTVNSSESLNLSTEGQTLDESSKATVTQSSVINFQDENEIDI
jgi:hypothetical protein